LDNLAAVKIDCDEAERQWQVFEPQLGIQETGQVVAQAATSQEPPPGWPWVQ
jgi:hypothetical protein